MKLNKIALTIAFVFPVVAIASSSGHHDVTMSNSDFWYRVLNFSIFAGLLYYLAASPIASFFKGRQADIASQLKEIEDKLQASKDEAKAAEAQLVHNKAKAKELIVDGANEAKILAENIAKKNEEALVVLGKSLDEKMELESKKMAKNVINRLLQDGISNDDIAVDESKVVSLISKKVA
ncbi:F0F1 ATP synthase subunit B [Sulfurovum sp. bin170]|uniref:F0F1 ATP synthase subunit B family protein n=1 Tax=Sulfurovum sp. bin170 TaxID=2695268 RepID=UPI0013E0151B|nr:F0F1 ATP synthase subunit B [Sulfurovum sp. bin170]NEW60445.1 F0F1 ATP synthase subunit B [Sulfurovum sp. bin170]